MNPFVLRRLFFRAQNFGCLFHASTSQISSYSTINFLAATKIESKNMGKDKNVDKKQPKQQKQQKQNDGIQKKQCRLGIEVSKADNYSEWYSQVIFYTNLLKLIIELKRKISAVGGLVN